MKGLLVSDIHYRLKQLDWLASVASDFDLVVIAGDHLDIASAVDIEAQVVVTLKYLQRVADTTRLVVSSGNHDLNGRSAGGEKIAKWMSRVQRLGIPAEGDSLTLRVTLRFATEVLRDVRASDATFAAATRVFSPREIVELIFTVGYYMTVARLLETTGVGLDAPVGTAVVDSIR